VQEWGTLLPCDFMGVGDCGLRDLGIQELRDSGIEGLRNCELRNLWIVNCEAKVAENQPNAPLTSEISVTSSRRIPTSPFHLTFNHSHGVFCLLAGEEHQEPRPPVALGLLHGTVPV